MVVVDARWRRCSLDVAGWSLLQPYRTPWIQIEPTNAIGMACILPNYVCNYIDDDDEDEENDYKVEQWNGMPPITKFLKLAERIEYET